MNFSRWFFILMACLCIGVMAAPDFAPAQLAEVEGVGNIRVRGNPSPRDKQRGYEEALRDAYLEVSKGLAQGDVQKKVFRDRLDEMILEDLEYGTESIVKVREVERRGTYMCYLRVKFKDGVIEDMLLEPDTENLERMQMRRIMVVIPEEHIGRPVPDPAGETEVINVFLRNNFRVVDQQRIKEIRESDAVKAAVQGASDTELISIATSFGADYIIVGEAFSHELPADQRLGNMTGCRARVEARMIKADTGEILVADGKEAGAVDMSELIAGKKALREAANELAEVFVSQLMKRAEIMGDEEFITIEVGGASFGQKEEVKRMLNNTPEVIEVREVEYQMERARLEVTTSVGAGALAGIIYTAAANNNLVFDITEQTAARIIGRMIPQPVAPIIADTPEPAVPSEPEKPRPPQDAGQLDDGTLVEVGNQRWVALLIGINDYSMSGGNIPSLQTPKDDVDDLAEALRSKYRFDTITMKIDRQATLRGLRESFDQLGATLEPNDNVLIYFAGHGHLQKNTDVGLWITADSTDHLDGLYNAEIKAYIAKMPARRVLLVSDSCYSGDFLRRALGRPTYEDLEEDPVESVRISAKLAKNMNPSRQVITSGNLNPVPDQGTGFCKGHSPFACALINALESAPVGAALSANDLYHHIYLQMKEGSGFDSESGPQKGTLPEHRGGEFFFVRFN